MGCVWGACSVFFFFFLPRATALYFRQHLIEINLRIRTRKHITHLRITRSRRVLEGRFMLVISKKHFFFLRHRSWRIDERKIFGSTSALLLYSFFFFYKLYIVCFFYCKNKIDSPEIAPLERDFLEDNSNPLARPETNETICFCFYFIF